LEFFAVIKPKTSVMRRDDDDQTFDMSKIMKLFGSGGRI
jgi:hypothetical protein